MKIPHYTFQLGYVASFLSGIASVYLMKKSKKIISHILKKRKKSRNISQLSSTPTIPNTPSPQSNQDKSTWLILADSVIGKSHISSNTVCQDSHYYTPFSEMEGWGIAVVSDGAGSAKHSEIGSKFIAEQAVPHFFKKGIKEKQWDKQNTLPSDEEWAEFAWEQLKNCAGALYEYGEKELDIPFKDLSCTVIAVVISPHGLLVTHIGDGRAGYCTHDGTWNSMIQPHKGEEANMTYFLTSHVWATQKGFRTAHNVPIPESRIIRETATAFTLLSDGMENHCFECLKKYPDKDLYFDSNQPYGLFYNVVIDMIKKIEDKASRNEKWTEILTKGNKKIEDEPDDKTMILAVLQ